MASGILLVAAFPPFNLVPLLFIALVPWLASLDGASGKGAWRRGYVFGLTFALGQLSWLGSFVTHWTGSGWLGAAPWVLASVLMALYFGLLGVLVQRCLGAGWLWGVPIAWAGVEVFRSFLPVFAFPWGVIATPLWRFPALAASAHAGSIYLVSGWVVCVNLLLWSLVSRRWDRGAGIVGGLAAAIPLLSFALYVRPEPTSTARIAIGQPGVDMAFGDPATEATRVAAKIDGIIDLAAKNGSKLLVLPEGVAPTNRAGSLVVKFHLRKSLPTIFGGQRGTGPVYQTAFGFDGNWQAVDKTRLVIFGEFVPLRDVLPFLSAFDLPSGDLSPGTRGVLPMKLAGLTVGPMLCFEGLFPDVGYRQSLNGAQLLAVISIDDWFMDSYAPAELMEDSVWRAIETGLPEVRAASTGYSFATDGKGRLLAEATLGSTQTLTVDLPIPLQPSPARWLPAFPFASFLFAAGLLFVRRPIPI